MATAIGGPRVLLRQLRETMAEPLASQDRLDKIVTLIATNMRADVCSFYVLRDDGALELFATYGLKRESGALIDHALAAVQRRRTVEAPASNAIKRSRAPFDLIGRAKVPAIITSPMTIYRIAPAWRTCGI